MNRWVTGARPRTLPAAVVPVLAGTGVAAASGGVIWWRAGVALVVAVSIQIATNYANDYSDGIRGTDDRRVGPVRLVASMLATPVAVRRAALVAFGVAAIGGLALTVAVGPQLLPVGAACLAAGWFYTGGPRPYGYAGLGELSVFVFFGLVATQGTAYVQTGRLVGAGWLVAAAVGLLATALLVINNLRDIPGDTLSGKRTLAVRLGDPGTRLAYVACLSAAFIVAGAVAPWRIGALAALLALPLAAGPIRLVRGGAAGRELVPVLGATARLQLVFGLALAAGIARG